MAITSNQVDTNNTLEQFRVEFNKLRNDVSGLEAGTINYTALAATTGSSLIPRVLSALLSRPLSLANKCMQFAYFFSLSVAILLFSWKKYKTKFHGVIFWAIHAMQVCHYTQMT